MRALFVVVLWVALGSSSLAQEKDKENKGFLSVLRAGQPVAVKEFNGRYEITMLDDARLGYKVTEVGSDFVVIEDVAGITEMRIPVTSIKVITRVKLRR